MTNQASTTSDSIVPVTGDINTDAIIEAPSVRGDGTVTLRGLDDITEDQRELNAITVEIQNHQAQIELSQSQAEHCKEQEGRSYFEIGRLLLDAKAKVKMIKGAKWLDWLQENFGMSKRTAQKLMDTYKVLGDAQALSHFGYTKVSMLATLPAEKREAFLSQQHEVKGGESKSAEAMTTREFERAVRRCKEPKARAARPRITVEGFKKRLSSLGTRLDELVQSLALVDSDSDDCRELLDALLRDRVTKLSKQGSEVDVA